MEALQQGCHEALWCLTIKAIGGWEHVLRAPGLDRASQPCDCHPPISVPLPCVLQHFIPNIHFLHKVMWVSPAWLSPSGPGHCPLSVPGLCRWPERSSSQTPGSPPSQRRGQFLERIDGHTHEESSEIPQNTTSHLGNMLTLAKPFQRPGFNRIFSKHGCEEVTVMMIAIQTSLGQSM